MTPNEMRQASSEDPEGASGLVAFFGGRHRASDLRALSAKSSSAQELIGLLLLVASAGMIAIVLWCQLSTIR